MRKCLCHLRSLSKSIFFQVEAWTWKTWRHIYLKGKRVSHVNFVGNVWASLGRVARDTSSLFTWIRELKSSAVVVISFLKTENLWKHMREFGIIYMQLDTKFSLKTLLNSGINDCVMRVGNIHRCTVCGRDFSEPQNCKRHVREKHFGLDQESCPHCQITIAKRNLKAHIFKCKAAASF